jgi:membrane protein YqaA with SNARE-associated domain
MNAATVWLDVPIGLFVLNGHKQQRQKAPAEEAQQITYSTAVVFTLGLSFSIHLKLLSIVAGNFEVEDVSETKNTFLHSTTLH